MLFSCLSQKRQAGKIMDTILRFYDTKPYTASFLISIVLFTYMIFYTKRFEVQAPAEQPEKLQFVNLDEVVLPKKRVKKQVSTEEGAEPSEDVDRAQGSNESEVAVDLSFFPNIAPPKPVGRLKKIYPDAARAENIEATVMVELIIAPNGKVSSVKIVGTRISKDLPPEQYSAMTLAFAQAATQILMGAQFTPPVVNGKKVPVKMELPLKFNLDQIR